jgi:amicyanin
MMKFASLAVLVLAAGSATAPLGAQSLLYRPPNLGGTWVPDPGVVQFNFLHRFYVTEGPANEVLNFPTFTVATGLGHSLGIGWHFGTNSIVGPGRSNNNESEWYVRWRLPGVEGRTGVTVAVTAAYNELAQSGDGEIGVDYAIGRLTLSGAARGMTHAFRQADARAALAGGFVARLTDYVAVNADVGSLVSPTTRAAWSAGISLLIPGSPHTFSLQASNAATSTIQGNSQGLVNRVDGSTRVLYGFEFTIPLHLKRFSPWFKGSPKPVAVGGPAGAAVAAQIRMAALKFQTDSVVISSGQTVRWVNDEPVEHTVTFDGAEPGSPPIPQNGTYSHRFDKPGTYTYHCTPHPFMKGVVVVK